MIVINIQPHSHYQTLIELCLLMFIFFLISISQIELLIKLLLVMFVLLLWLIQRTFLNKQHITQLQLTTNPENPWVIIQENDTPVYASLIQIQDYKMLLHLTYKTTNNQSIYVNLWKDSIPPEQWRKLHILKRLTQKNNKFS